MAPTQKPAVNNAMDIKLPVSAQSDPAVNAEDGSANVSSTTKFHEDDEIVVKEFPRYVSIGETFKDDSLSSREHEIKTFLARPVLCGSGTYTTTSVVGVPLTTISLPSDCLSNPAYAAKVSGFYAFRAKMVCRIQINAQRFQQGRLILHYLPQVTNMSANRLSTALLNLSMITQQPRVDLELGKDTEVRLEIPYVSNTMYYNMLTGAHDFGKFYLTPYAALRTGDGSVSCPFSVFCHFEDVELRYPAAPQSGVKTLRARGRRGATIDYSGQELANEGLGPISGILTKVSNATSILSEIPLISSFTAPTSWALGVMGRAATALGYSKPTNAGASEKRTLSVFHGMTNVNIVDNSVKMAVGCDNAVSHLPGFAGTDVDEMSFTYLASIPSFGGVSTWTTGMTQGTVIHTIPVGPVQVSTQNSITTGGVTYNAYSYPPMGYIANNFEHWRGSITYIFKIVKTEFHSGRLLVAFFPGDNLATATFANSIYAFREILDVRTATEFSITVPYVSLTPYKQQTAFTGYLRVFVLNSLQAPASISQTTDVIFELAAGPDFEVAVPKNSRLTPCLVRPQSGLSTIRKIQSVIDDSTVAPAIEPSLYCIGERVESVRQMIKRASRWYTKGATTASNVVMISPQVNYVPTVALTGGLSNIVNAGVDQLSYYAPLFRYQRGSVRVKITDPTQQLPLFAHTRYNVTLHLMPSPVMWSTTAAEKKSAETNSFTVPTISGGGEYEIPYYSQTHASHVSITSADANTHPRSAEDTKTTLVISQQGSATPDFSSETTIYRCAGDDFSFGFFIGTIPLVTNTILA